MPIVNYPDTPGGYENRIDRQQKGSKLLTVVDHVDLNVAALSLSLYNLEESWKVREVAFAFSNANARTFTIKKKSGRGIVSLANSYFWLAQTSAVAQRIDLDEGFYDTATAFVAHVKAQLDANQAFSDAGVTFTVAHGAATKLISITPSSGQVKYVDNNTAAAARPKSVASPVLGFTADQGFAASVTGDEPIDIGTEYVIDSNVGDTSTSYIFTDELDMDIDTELLVESAAGPAVEVTVKVTYEIL